MSLWLGSEVSGSLRVLLVLMSLSCWAPMVFGTVLPRVRCRIRMAHLVASQKTRTVPG